MQTENWMEPVQAYHNVRQALADAEQALAEYAGALEEYGLEIRRPDEQPVRCREGWLTPDQLRRKAASAAVRVERLTAACAGCRSRAATALLNCSTDAAQYEALYRVWLGKAV